MYMHTYISIYLYVLRPARSPSPRSRPGVLFVCKYVRLMQLFMFLFKAGGII